VEGQCDGKQWFAQIKTPLKEPFLTVNEYLEAGGKGLRTARTPVYNEHKASSIFQMAQKDGKNMPRLLLSGGGSAEDLLLLDQLLVHLTAGGNMLYLPIAMDLHQRPYAFCYQWIRSVFTPLGLDLVTMWSDVRACP